MTEISNGKNNDERVTLAHGHGGLASHKLINDSFLPLFSSPELDPLDDAAIADLESGKIAFSTDSFVVQPLFFPGGDIGKLAVAGTVNDLAVMGAKPVLLSVAFIIEEGFPLYDLERINRSIAETSRDAGVRVATGDTKVVPKGAADGLFVNTTGIGIRFPGVSVSGSFARVGQAVLLTGPAGDHGAAIICARNELGIEGDIKSDCRPLWDLISVLLDKLGSAITVMRDPTRGGVATTLNEISRASGVGIEIDENAIPVRPSTRAVCEILGFDPLYLANEGAALIILDDDKANSALEIIHAHPAGKFAVKIGEISDNLDGKVVLKT
ncbi:MAG: hydrogenase expression/formation protein HypE, partial [bacterium]